MFQMDATSSTGVCRGVFVCDKEFFKMALQQIYSFLVRLANETLLAFCTTFIKS
jgi:hypothetical protein